MSPRRIVFADYFPVRQHIVSKRRLVDIVLDPLQYSEQLPKHAVFMAVVTELCCILHTRWPDEYG